MPKLTVKEWVKNKNKKQKLTDDDKENCSQVVDTSSEEEEEIVDEITEEDDPEKEDLVWLNMTLNVENRVLTKKLEEQALEIRNLYHFIKEIKASLVKEAEEYIKNKK
nr:MAG TPA: hypothetical protein [Cressdnaviricota sp.]